MTTTDTGGGGGGLLTTTEKGEPAVGPAAADVDWTGFTGARMTVGAAAVTVGTVVMTVVVEAIMPTTILGNSNFIIIGSGERRLIGS